METQKFEEKKNQKSSKTRILTRAEITLALSISVLH